MKSDEPFRVVCVFDPAIDTSKMNLDQAVEYGRTRDLKMVQDALKPGERPMVFSVRQANRAHEAYIMTGETEEQRNERAFACLVVSCKDFWTKDGRRVDKEFTSGNGQSSAMTDKELESVPWLVRQEIGQVANTRARFLLPWSEHRYLLPHGSASALVQRYESTSPADESQTNSTSEETGSSSSASTDEALEGVPTYAESMAVHAAAKG